MNRQRASGPRVYAAISAVTADLASTGIAKLRVNHEEHYDYRSIDDVSKALAPLLARHKLCILPRVLDRNMVERHDAKNTLLISVSLRVAFDLVSARDGSIHSIETYGEALDNGDKATAKAMSAAYKHAMVQAFCIPVPDVEDADSASPRLTMGQAQPDPVQGWEQWSLDIQDLVGSCESVEAVVRVQNTYRDLLRAASKRRPNIYATIGKTVARRREALVNAVSSAAAQSEKTNGSSAQEAMTHA